MITEKSTLVLLVSGFFGTLVRLVLAPEKSWKKWLSRFVVGISSAVFLGGLIGHLITKWLDLSGDVEGQSWAIAASGFIVGTAAEQVLANIQKRISNDISDSD